MKKAVGGIILAAFALIGCSTTMTENKKATEGLCTGTKKPYQVKGNWYSPQNHYDYKEEGVASWYGPRFHGRPKSCGEIFNMHGISAAHKTLPIPSVVKVTNIKNGTSVKLLIDDRGPFVDDRIIDLSKGAATYLGLCNQGLGKVRVECLPEESQAFAQFVSQYGRYGKDPQGRSWETIFRQNFHAESGFTQTKMVRPLPSTRMPRQESWPQATSVKAYQPARKARIKTIPISSRLKHKPEYGVSKHEEEINDQEIEELLAETRSYMRRKRA